MYSEPTFPSVRWMSRMPNMQNSRSTSPTDHSMDVDITISSKHAQLRAGHIHRAHAPPELFYPPSTTTETPSTTKAPAPIIYDRPASSHSSRQSPLDTLSLPQHHVDVMRQPDWDEKTIITGKKTTTAAKPRPSTQSRPSRPAVVDVYVGDTFVAAIPKKLLTRFSAVANDAFLPKVSATANGQSDAAGQEGNMPEFPGTAKLTNLYNVSSSARISFSLLDVQIQPSRNAVQACIDWMNENGTVESTPPPFFVDDPEETPLTTLTDLYAATTCMALRPIGRDLRDEVLNRVNQTITEVAMMKHVHERLRIGGYVHEQMLKVYMNCVEQELLTNEEQKAIDDFVASDAALDAAVEDTRGIRERYWAYVERRHNAAEREERAAAARQAHQDESSSRGSGGGRGRSGEGGRGSGRSRAGSASLGNARGVRGRHVPGA